MAALDTPWLSSMSLSSTYRSEDAPSTPLPSYDPNPPTVAAFSPNTLSGSSATSKQRSTIIVHKKSPLLVATPPQITRALAYSHPFLLPLNKLVGLLSWSTKDPWESFLLVAGFWATVIYGSDIIRYAGPPIIVILIILGMYSRRYSPLSSTSQTGEKHEQKGHRREASEATSRHHKSLDEIVETLREFTTRCNLLLDPFLRLTDFLSTQRTPTSATTRPALTTLFIRILLVTPLWIAITLPPFYILTARRVILAIGTICLTWHSRPARVSRVILWRSILIRRTCSLITGLSFSSDPPASAALSNSLLKPALPPRRKSQTNLATELATKRRPSSSGVRFTFILYENQRRWIGLGWTTSLFAYERGPWTDEHLNPAPAKDEFELPDVEGRASRWRWIDNSTWKIENGDRSDSKTTAANKVGLAGAKELGADGGGWMYYDNKWDDGRREDGWGRYTRRRKWYRDAELVEATPSTEVTPSPTPNVGFSDAEESTKSLNLKPKLTPRPKLTHGEGSVTASGAESESAAIQGDDASIAKKRKAWFGKGSSNGEKGRERSDSKSSSGQNTGKLSGKSDWSRDGPEDDHLDRWRDRERSIAGGGPFGVGEDLSMGLS